MYLKIVNKSKIINKCMDMTDIVAILVAPAIIEIILDVINVHALVV
jgi:hypothetical protein